ncbi:hypothetical protein [uncultured Desulfovibrio sp.]|uniref:hypothetical protein n=1 Tax=uncultured Desulfovibrio sp. TaxID=167968 RepID=UPI00272BE8E1|nr:hypothetical protein [uncultured Desulfovibrio sp.]
MSGKTTLFPRNDGGEQIENLYFQSKNAIERLPVFYRKMLYADLLAECARNYPGENLSRRWGNFARKMFWASEVLRDIQKPSGNHTGLTARSGSGGSDASIERKF